MFFCIYGDFQDTWIKLGHYWSISHKKRNCYPANCLSVSFSLSLVCHSSLQLALATWRLNSRTTAHSAPRTKASHLKTRSTHLGLPRRAAWCSALKPLLLVRVMSAAWSNNRANMSSRFLEIASWRGVSPSESCKQKTYFPLCYIYSVSFNNQSAYK